MNSWGGGVGEERVTKHKERLRGRLTIVGINLGSYENAHLPLP